MVPSLIRRIHEAKERGERTVTVWGTGLPRREFIFAPDLADACIAVMNRYDEADPINLGTGTEHSIAEMAALIAEVVEYHGRLSFDPRGRTVRRVNVSTRPDFWAWAGGRAPRCVQPWK